jgi:hypothetical protein
VPEAPDTVKLPLVPWVTASDVTETDRLVVADVTVTLMVRLRLESFTVTVALPALTPLTVTTPLWYLAVATDVLDEDTDTLPEAPETLAVADEPCEIMREVGLTLRLLFEELWELSFLSPLPFLSPSSA